MKIAICASLDFTHEIKDIADQLAKHDHVVTIPQTSEMILKNKVDLEKIKQEKDNGQISKRAIKQDSIRQNYKRIKESNAVLILNFDKKEIKNYIGGNTFLEIGFAHILNKNIFLLNPIPEMPYTDEIKAMQPIVIDNNLDKIK